jgi:hypothetical protein
LLMFNTFTPPHHPVLKKWDDWAIENNRLDMRAGIWACYDLLRGSTLPEVKATAEKFLSERVDSPDLRSVREAIEKAKHSPRKDSGTDLNPSAELGLF